ncbi:restriction endonuclease subunit S (plasmid) [Lactococcus lactis subsp. lactis]|uniref:Restriction endonuclease subunit S n=1 Tax=Lactococcus lactis subsp. lactis TaxID=1360 RepID=A0AAF0SU45_LACLL|nr:restriction endonuclease subunit S [Lactococcus lactis]WMD27461.1 restriction endonuclease subunit S [Lactococcus lactis subsp. lactis]
MAKIDDSVKKKIPELRFEGFTDAWEQRKLGEVATLSSSKRIHLSDYVTEGIPFYRGSEISTGGITGNQELFISQEKFDEIKEKYGVPSEGDILVTAVGTLGNLWKVDSRRFYYKDGNLIQISKIQVNSDYLLTYFTGGIGKKRLLDSAAGSNQKALTMVKMREITVDFPSEDEQKKLGPSSNNSMILSLFINVSWIYSRNRKKATYKKCSLKMVPKFLNCDLRGLLTIGKSVSYQVDYVNIQIE